jgi:hypothetical protein
MENGELKRESVAEHLKSPGQDIAAIAVRNMKKFLENQDTGTPIEVRYKEAMDFALAEGGELYEKLAAELENPATKEQALAYIKDMFRCDVVDAMNTWSRLARENEGVEDYIKEKG